MTDLYRGMNAVTLETQYNVRQHRQGDFDQLVESWLARSARVRERRGVQTDLSYGEGAREKLDWFPARVNNAPLLIYIHGGYWQRGDKSMYGFIADGLMSNGISVAVINYDLAPSVRIGQIPSQIRKAIAWLWHHSSELQFDRDQLFVSGHSAGGQLTAMMMATDWAAYDSIIPLDVVRGGIPISGLYDLVPLVYTSINDVPQMDVNQARTWSPCSHPPLTDAPQLVAVGGGETNEFLRQADDYAAQYRTASRKMERHNIAMDDHFDELNRLADDHSVFFEKVMEFVFSN